jgi:hypothetical protein
MFKTWKLRKNLSQSEWEFVNNRIQKRKLDDKESELYVNGIKIPNKRVKKETSRHSRLVLSASQPDFNSGNIQYTP